MPTDNAPQKPKDGDEEPGNGPGDAPATRRNVIWMSSFSMGLTLLLFYLLIELWPHPTPAMVYSTTAVAVTSDTTPRDTAASPADTTTNRPDTAQTDMAADTTGTGGAADQPATPATPRT